MGAIERHASPGARHGFAERTGIPAVVYVLALTIFSLTTSEFMVAAMTASLSQAPGSRSPRSAI